MNTMTAPEPLVRKPASPEQEDDAYFAWIRAELTRRGEHPGKEIPHAQVMAEMKAIIESKRKRA